MSRLEPELQKNHTAWQRRMFLSERLFNVWLHKNKLKAEHFNVYYYGEDRFASERGLFGRFLARAKRELSMMVSRLTPHKEDPAFKKTPHP